MPTGDWIFNNKGEALTNVDPQNATTNKNISFKKGCHAFHIIPIKRFRDEGILWEFNVNDPHLIEMLKKMDDDDFNNLEKIHICYGIHKAYEDIKDYENAFK